MQKQLLTIDRCFHGRQRLLPFLLFRILFGYISVTWAGKLISEKMFQSNCAEKIIEWHLSVLPARPYEFLTSTNAHVRKATKTKNHKDARASKVCSERGSFLACPTLEGKSAVGAVEEYDAAVCELQSMGFTLSRWAKFPELTLPNWSAVSKLPSRISDISRTIADGVRRNRPELDHT